MGFSWSVLISLILVLLAIGKSSAIECYQCGSLLQADPACEDPFNAIGVSTTTCLGSCTKVKGMRGDVQIILRGCSLLPLTENCAEETQSGVEVNACACNSDRCNSATTTSVSMATILVVAVASFLFNFIF